MADTRAASGGLGVSGLGGLLVIVLLGLTLTGVVTWSWWWILAPFWIMGLLW